MPVLIQSLYNVLMGFGQIFARTLDKNSSEGLSDLTDQRPAGGFRLTDKSPRTLLPTTMGSR